ncbi:MAG: PLP-dependent aminotransferase family protein, partial [Anaerovorax sp.]
MKPIIPDFHPDSKRPLYLELYDEIQSLILEGGFSYGEKLPSLRALSKSLGLSLTTIELAYNQLSVEGYITSKPQSGYYVNRIAINSKVLPKKSPAYHSQETFPLFDTPSEFLYDPSCFDFIKWKKCMNKILTEHSHLLLHESDPQGEFALRYEISNYIYRSRGVVCSPEQIVIGAGTQQITNQLSVLLTKIDIKHVAVEAPGYLPVLNIFRDRNFAITHVPVEKEGIKISKLPSNIRSAVYVNPSNQFPTGYVMPIGKRYELLKWAKENDSIIIEDDYDSELRYFGNPVPSLQGLDTSQRVVYLGSFSSTLFPSIKISYMVLPPILSQTFTKLKHNYSQTCSKTEQLTLALYMEKGLYQINIKKLRTLYAQKLQGTISAFSQFGDNFIFPRESSSGINMLINIKSAKTSEILCQEAKELGIMVLPITIYTDEPTEAYK